jgi:Zn-dependent protease
MIFSKIEIEQLVKSWLIVSIAFSIAQVNGIFGISELNLVHFSLLIAISAVTVGSAFIVHELSHKFFAQKFNCFAEFRYNMQMLTTGLIFSLFGFLFIAPGAVIIHGPLTKLRYGIISLAGPLSNIFMAIFFLALKYLSPISLIMSFSDFAFKINAWIGLFNLIPMLNFDGTKILAWNKVVYGLAILVAGTLMVLSYII